MLTQVQEADRRILDRLIIQVTAMAPEERQELLSKLTAPDAEPEAPPEIDPDTTGMVAAYVRRLMTSERNARAEAALNKHTAELVGVFGPALAAAARELARARGNAGPFGVDRAADDIVWRFVEFCQDAQVSRWDMADLAPKLSQIDFAHAADWLNAPENQD